MLSASPGNVKPTEYDSRRRTSQSNSSWVPPAPSTLTSTFFPRFGPPGSWAGAAPMTALWSATVLDPAFPLRSSTARGSPVPSGPWSRNAHSGWKPKPRLNVGAACSFSLCAVTRVASTSMTSGAEALVAWSGACSPANCQARARTAARAVLIAFSAAGASAASASTVRETVGSEATRPYRPGSVRSNAMSARQSPPTASVTARSSSTLPGSWAASGLRHGASAADTAASSPIAATVSVSSTPPA